MEPPTGRENKNDETNFRATSTFNYLGAIFKNPIVIEGVSGAGAGVAETLVGFPFDTLKVRQVVDSGKNKTSLLRYTKDIIRNEGVGSLYRGIMSPLAGAVVQNMNIFVSYSASERLIKPYFEENSLKTVFFAGCLASFPVSVLDGPVELVKNRMQITPGARYIPLMKQMGIRGLFQGFTATVVRNVPSVGFYFAGHEAVKRQFPENPYLGSFLGGAVGGFGCWGLTYPLDYIKTVMQSDNIDPKKRKYKNYLDACRKINWRNSFRGYGPCVIRAMAVNPFVFLAYTKIRDLCLL